MFNLFKGSPDVGPITAAIRKDETDNPPTQKAAHQFTSQDFFNGVPMPTAGGDAAGAYSNSWVAYSCIRRLAQDAASVPLLFLADPEDPESILPDAHPTRRLFERPNEHFNRGEFIEWFVNTLNRRGEAFILFDDPDRPARMYSHTDPLHWREIVEAGDLLGWDYRHRGVTKALTPLDVIHHRFLDPSRPYRGLAPAVVAADALSVHTGADQLARSVVARGGEKSIVYKAEHTMTDDQRLQTVQALRARHARRNEVGADVLLPNGVAPIDPKFIDDGLRLLDAAAAQPDKICAVYGVPKSLLGFEDIDKFATFAGRKKMFYTDTLMPMLSGVEAAFDRMFTETLVSRYRCFVRFDWGKVPAMQEDTGDRFEVAGRAHKAGLPWSVCNDRFQLGLDADRIPGANTIMVSSTLAPLEKLLAEWDAPSPSIPQGGANGAADTDGDGKAAPAPTAKGGGLTNALIKRRAGNTRDRVQRHLRQLKRENELRADWKALHTPAMNKAIKAAKTARTVAEVTAALKTGFDGLAKAAGELVNKYHVDSALEGETSILELIDGKMGDAERAAHKAVHQWRPDVARMIRERENLIVGLVDNDLWEDIKGFCVQAVKEGTEGAELQHIIRTRWASAPGGINRATTIARTEVGTAYNVARFAEIKGQEFDKHEWLTAGDEMVRKPPESKFDHSKCQNVIREVGKTFPCGLEYPMASGGEAGNVINCRCETIPVI